MELQVLRHDKERFIALVKSWRDTNSSKFPLVKVANLRQFSFLKDCLVEANILPFLIQSISSQKSALKSPITMIKTTYILMFLKGLACN